MTLLIRPKVVAAPQPEPANTRNRRGCANIFLKSMGKGDRVTLQQAIDILKAGW